MNLTSIEDGESIVKTLLCFSLIALLSSPHAKAQQPIANRHVDYAGFAELTDKLLVQRESHRVTEGEFVKMSRDENTILLDTRSAPKYEELHVKGAVHLNFADITEESLASIIPSTETRILIYCNNNFENAPAPFPLKIRVAALNIPTFVTLHAYGYENVYELGPVIDPANSLIEFEGRAR